MTSSFHHENETWEISGKGDPYTTPIHDKPIFPLILPFLIVPHEPEPQHYQETNEKYHNPPLTD